MSFLTQIVHRSNHVSSLRLFAQAKRLVSTDNNDGKSDLPIKRKLDQSELQVIKMPDENPVEPKKYVFQELRQLQNSQPCYTLEEAAEYRPMEHQTIYFKYPTLAQQHRDMDYCLRGVDNQDTLIYQFPEATDFVCVGSGLIGSATAYYLKKFCSRTGDVLVLDKEPYTRHNSTALCNGLLSSQSKCQETIRMAGLSKELLRHLSNDLVVTKEDLAQIKYRPVTHLVLWRESDVKEVLEAIDMQQADGCYTEAKLPEELEQSFPWLKACNSDIALGSHGNQDEALVDPVGLRNLYRTLAQAYGANFIKAELIDFNTMYSITSMEIDQFSVSAGVARLPSTGQLRHFGFAKLLLCSGHNTPYLEEKSELDAHVRAHIEDLHFIQPRLRIHFSFHSLNAPVINFPVITDTDGSMLIKDDYCGDFKYFLTYEESETFLDTDNTMFMDIDSDDPFMNYIHKSDIFKNYFDNVIKPRLVKRIPIMEDATFNLAFSGFESHNTHDGNPVISEHPYHHQLLVSGGYGSRLMTFGPASAMFFAEMMIYDKANTIDLTKYYWNRVIKGRNLDEFKSLVS